MVYCFRGFLFFGVFFDVKLSTNLIHLYLTGIKFTLTDRVTLKAPESMKPTAQGAHQWIPSFVSKENPTGLHNS